MTFLGFLAVTVFNSLTYISLQTTLIINSTLMASIAPVLMIGFSWLIFKTKTTLLQFAGIFLSLIPLFSTLMAIYFYNEQFQFFHLIGAILIILGLFLSNKEIKNA